MVLAERGGRARPSVADRSRPERQKSQAVIGERFDFPGPVPLRKSYIVASTPRCGSTFLCSLLWKTGVLGAPSEYWNCHKSGARKTIGIRMMERLQAISGADYLKKLLARRTSPNGVFGLKVHFLDFQEVLRGFPQVLDHLSPVTFISIERQDKIAQAVSLAKSLQTGAWTAKINRQRPAVTYNRDLIARCLASLDAQRIGWLRWFEANRIDPYFVTYEKLAADKDSVVSGIIEMVGVGRDERYNIELPAIERQSDGTSKEWADRFKSESAVGGGGSNGASTSGIEPKSDDHSPARGSAGSHFFDKYDRIKIVEVVEQERQGGLGVFAKKRRRARYEAIIAHNRALFWNARVLDVQCGSGIWCLAALDAGAAHVVGLDSRIKPIRTAEDTFIKYGVEPDLYRFVRGRVLTKLTRFPPDRFDLIICQDAVSDLHFLFSELHRLNPKHVIVDTSLNLRLNPVVTFNTTTFKIRTQAAPAPGLKPRRRMASIVAVPNHEVITILSERFGFQCRAVDWRNLGFTDWVGIGDYENDRRRTYVLDRIG
jgi:trehalose 2-sulfotransferase